MSDPFQSESAVQRLIEELKEAGGDAPGPALEVVKALQCRLKTPLSSGRGAWETARPEVALIDAMSDWFARQNDLTTADAWRRQADLVRRLSPSGPCSGYIQEGLGLPDPAVVRYNIDLSLSVLEKSLNAALRRLLGRPLDTNSEAGRLDSEGLWTLAVFGDWDLSEPGYCTFRGVGGQKRFELENADRRFLARLLRSKGRAVRDDELASACNTSPEDIDVANAMATRASRVRKHLKEHLGNAFGYEIEYKDPRSYALVSCNRKEIVPSSGL